MSTFFIPTVTEQLFRKLRDAFYGDDAEGEGGGKGMPDTTWMEHVVVLALWLLARSALSGLVTWHTPVGGAYRPPTLSSLMRHILHLPATKDQLFLRKDFVPLFDVRSLPPRRSLGC